MLDGNDKKMVGGLPASVRKHEPGEYNVGRLPRDTTKSSTPPGSIINPKGGR